MKKELIEKFNKIYDGEIIELTHEEAEELGLMPEDAISEEDALNARFENYE